MEYTQSTAHSPDQNLRPYHGESCIAVEDRVPWKFMHCAVLDAALIQTPSTRAGRIELGWLDFTNAMDRGYGESDMCSCHEWSNRYLIQAQRAARLSLWLAVPTSSTESA